MKTLVIRPAKLLIPAMVLMAMITVGSIIYGQKGNQQQAQTRQLKDGVEICFQRVTQTFVSILIGESSGQYLQDGFRATTGECFSELNRMAAKDFSKVLATLSDRAYWFNQEVGELMKLSGENEVGEILNFSRRKNVVDRYMKMEDARFIAEEKIDAAMTKIASNDRMGTIIFWSSGSLFILVSLFMLTTDFKRRGRMQKIEQAAFHMSGIGPHVDLKEVSPLIQQVLQWNNLKVTSDLWNKCTQWWDERATFAKPEVAAVKVEVENQLPKINLERSFQLIQGQSKRRYEVNVSQVLSKLIEMNSSTIFKKGIVVDIQVDETMVAQGDNPEIEMAMFSILANALGYALKSVKGRRISFIQQTDDANAVIRLKISGHVFNVDEMSLAGHLNSNPVDMDLVLVEELARDMNIKLNLLNVATREYGVESVIDFELPQVVFKTSTSNLQDVSGHDDSMKGINPRLVKLFKGSKKELSEQMVQSKVQHEGNGAVI